MQVAMSYVFVLFPPPPRPPHAPDDSRVASPAAPGPSAHPRSQRLHLTRVPARSRTASSLSLGLPQPHQIARYFSDGLTAGPDGAVICCSSTGSEEDAVIRRNSPTFPRTSIGVWPLGELSWLNKGVDSTRGVEGICFLVGLRFKGWKKGFGASPRKSFQVRCRLRWERVRRVSYVCARGLAGSTALVRKTARSKGPSRAVTRDKL